MAALAAGLTEGLTNALAELATFHGGVSGPWVGELEASVIRGLKTIEADGLTSEEVAQAVNFSLQTVRSIFAEFRTSLASTVEDRGL